MPDEWGEAASQGIPCKLAVGACATWIRELAQAVVLEACRAAACAGTLLVPARSTSISAHMISERVLSFIFPHLRHRHRERRAVDPERLAREEHIQYFSIDEPADRDVQDGRGRAAEQLELPDH